MLSIPYAIHTLFYIHARGWNWKSNWIEESDSLWHLSKPACGLRLGNLDAWERAWCASLNFWVVGLFFSRGRIQGSLSYLCDQSQESPFFGSFPVPSTKRRRSCASIKEICFVFHSVCFHFMENFISMDGILTKCWGEGYRHSGGQRQRENT